MTDFEFAKASGSSSSLVEVHHSKQPSHNIDVLCESHGSNSSEDQSANTPSEQIDGFMAHLLQCLGNDAFQLWFGPHTEVRLSQNHIIVQASNDFLVDCIRNFCQPDLNQAVRQYFGNGYSVELSTQKSAEASSPKVVSKAVEQPLSQTKLRVDSPTLRTLGMPPHSATSGTNAQLPKQQNLSVTNQSSANQTSANQPTANKTAPIRPKHDDTKAVPAFLVGASNRMAAAAVDMVVDKPGELGLLFVFGPNGVGKTHLCKTIRERLRTRCGMRRVMYMTAEQFTIDFSESTRGAGFAAFRKKYRDVEGLIIDDAQFFIGKQQTLAELRNTIDDLLGRRRQIVLTADRPLSELVAMGSDLHARLSGGVSCCLELLDSALRRDLLEDICRRHNVDLSKATLDALAARCTGDGRSLYGLVFRLLTQQRVAGQSLTHEQAMSCTYDLLQANQPVLRLPDIERVVCDSFGLDPKALRAKNRSKSVTAARMLAMFLARKHTAAAYSEIGQYFGNRQHSTVISAHKRVEDWLNSNEPLSHRTGTVSIREWVRNAEASLRVG